MARFDVFRNPGESAASVPFLLDVQSDVLSSFDTRIVIPLRRRDTYVAVKIPTNLMPCVFIDDVEFILETSKLAAVPVRILKQPITSVSHAHFEITAALDFLFQGF
jgi:toxin CcdB